MPSAVPHSTCLPRLVLGVLLLLGAVPLARAHGESAPDSALAGPDLRKVHPQDGPHGDLTIRVGHHRVRVQAQMNLVFADELVPSFREDPNVLHAVEQEDLRADLLDWLGENTALKINGVPTPFVAGEWVVLPPDLSRMPYYPRFGSRALTVIRLEMVHEAASPPDQVELTWNGYPPDLAVAPDGVDAPPLVVRARFSGYGVHESVDLSVDAPTHVWVAPPLEERHRLEDVPPPVQSTSSPLRVPSGALGGCAILAAIVIALRGTDKRRAWLAGAAGALLLAAGFALPPVEEPVMPDQAAATEIFHRLHQNLYRAFGFTEEEDIYEGLLSTVDLALLERLYTDIHKGLVQQEHGGAVSEVELVSPIETRITALGTFPPNDAPGFTVRERWQVQGAVHHFGHYHRRTTEYLADYTVVAGTDGWRIRDTNVIEQKRIGDETDDPNAGVDPNERGADF